MCSSDLSAARSGLLSRRSRTARARARRAAAAAGADPPSAADRRRRAGDDGSRRRGGSDGRARGERDLEAGTSPRPGHPQTGAARSAAGGGRGRGKRAHGCGGPDAAGGRPPARSSDPETGRAARLLSRFLSPFALSASLATPAGLLLAAGTRRAPDRRRHPRLAQRSRTPAARGAARPSHSRLRPEKPLRSARRTTADERRGHAP